MKSYSIPVVRGTALVVAASILFIPHGRAQEKPSNDASSSNDPAGAVHDLQDQVHKLQVMVDEMRAENAQSRAEMHQLRQDLQATRALLESPSAPAGAHAGEPPAAVEAEFVPAGAPPVKEAPAAIEDRVQKLEDSTSLMSSKIDEQYQTKVETASKYRARLHGIVLMNAFRNVGSSDDLDFPTYSEPVRLGSPGRHIRRHTAAIGNRT